MDKYLYHVNSSKHNVGGGLLGARNTIFNSAYTGRDSIHYTRMEVSSEPQCKYTNEEDQISVYLLEFFHLTRCSRAWSHDQARAREEKGSG